MMDDPTPLRRRRLDGTGIRDVARAAGVSAMSVSRALRGVDGVSEATRARILETARRLRYQPDSNARALTMANADLIGISLPTFANDVFADILSGMRRTFEQAGYSSIIDTTEYDPDVEWRWAERLLSWRPAAMILTGTDHHPALVARIREARVPTLEIWDWAPDPIDLCVGIDHHAAGVLIGRHAADLGYRAPVFIGAPEGRDRRADNRRRGLEAAFADRPAAPLRAFGMVEDNAFSAGAKGMRMALEAPGPRPDMAFFLNDHMAFGGMMTCGEMGLSVPGDIGIAGFNQLGLTSVLPVAMTTVRTPRREIGVIGARHVIARINGLSPDRAVALPVTVVPGATTSPRR